MNPGEQLAVLEAVLTPLGSAVVAYSGGLDSTVLALVAHRVLGARVVAVTSCSASLAPRERAEAALLASELGFPHRELVTDELELPGYVANAPDRCYHCKSSLFRHLAQVAREGYAHVLVGTHLGDLGDYRPGLRAAAEAGVRAPFVEAGLDKEAIRAIARHLGVRIWDKPAAACLASRIPYGTPVTLELLSRVAQAEEVLAALGFVGGRVRHHGELARIEVPPAALAAALAAGPELVTGLKALGYHYVTLDLEGYRVGSLNASLA